jgi:hypothetical protein
MTMTAERAGWSLPRVRGLTWITWRQHRFALLGVITLLGGFALLMIIHGAAMHGDYHRLGLDSCGSLSGAAC